MLLRYSFIGDAQASVNGSRPQAYPRTGIVLRCKNGFIW